MPDRAVMFTDLVDFSDLQKHPHFGGDIRERSCRFRDEVLKPHNNRVREIASRFSGSDEGTWGDSFFLVFDSAIEAVQCAVALLRSLRDSPIPTSPGNRAQLHIGIHPGYIEPFEDGYTGKAISTAARIISLAGTDHILVSDAARQLCGTIDGVEFRRRGDFLLKGEDGLLTIWEADWDGGGPRAMKRSALSGELDLPPIASLFVGRVAELEEIGTLVTQHQALLVEGLSGIGKTTTLVRLALHRFRDQRLADNAFFYFDCASRDMRSDVSGDFVLRQLGCFLTQIGADAAAVAVASSEKCSDAERVLAINHALVAMPCLLFLDNFQETLDQRGRISSSSFERILSSLLSHNLGQSRIVLASFEQWHIPDRIVVHPHRLGDLRREDAKLLLTQFDLGDEDLVDQALHIVGGHPQALQWFSKIASEDHIGTAEALAALVAVPRDRFTERQFHEHLARELLDRIWKRLTKPAQILLLAGAIYREPSSFDAIRHVANLDELRAREARQLLLNYFLVSAGGIGTPHAFHPLVREYASAHTQTDLALQTELNRRAADWWRRNVEKHSEAKAGIELHHHLLAAGDTSDAEEVTEELQLILYRAGRKASIRGLHQEALRFAELRLAQHPDDPAALRQVAQALARLGDSRAESFFRRALTLMPESGALRNAFGNFLATKHRDKEAAKQFESGIISNPTQPHPRMGYARFLASRGRTVDAEVQFRLGVLLAPNNPHLRLEYALFLVEKGRNREAERQFDDGIKACPKDGPLRSEYGRFLSVMGRFDEAEAQFLTGIQNSPLMPHCRVLFANFLSNAQRDAEAEHNYQEAIKLNPNSPLSIRAYAQFLATRRRTSEAEALFLQSIQITPQDPAGRNQYAMLLMESRRYKEACEQICIGLKAAPGDQFLLRTRHTLKKRGHPCECSP